MPHLSSDDRHAPPVRKPRDEDEEEDLNDANYDEVGRTRLGENGGIEVKGICWH